MTRHQFSITLSDEWKHRLMTEASDLEIPTAAYIRVLIKTGYKNLHKIEDPISKEIITELLQ